VPPRVRYRSDCNMLETSFNQGAVPPVTKSVAVIPPKHIKIVLLIATLVCLSSCASTAPDFNSLAAAAETHPPRNAIVGMWCDQERPLGYVDIRTSLLFKADGTFFQRTSVQTLAREVYTEKQFWQYHGNGVWTVEMKGPWLGTKTDRYRLSRGKLLRESAGGFGQVKRVYNRMK
jgi:hypothetical protein